ncbi:hypothetical protein EV359DRAFT_41648 [Lentinula novae-zelandiae]|nr:hypothetical protein EV359DRAFT_41648 [Lentinula novae-zelandiae]
MSFAFIPRKVSKKAPATSIPASAGNSKGKAAAINLPAATLASTVPAPRVDEELAEEFAILVVLSLTEYALWANADLRRRMEQTPEDEHGCMNYSWKSPLNVFNAIDQFAIVKAIRKHAEDNIEVRMVLSRPTWSNWGSSSAGTDEGMYEIQSKAKVSRGLEGAEGYMRNYWANRTIYIENIPPAHRTIHGIFQFVRDTYPSTNYPNIQTISFPPHYLDTDADTSSFHQIPKLRTKCKGFAFVVFSSVDEVDQFSATWKWERARSGPVPVLIKADTSPSLLPRASSASSHVEARKHGFRGLPKTQWDALKDEYVAWRQKLLEQVLAEQDDDVDEEMNSALQTAKTLPTERPTSVSSVSLLAPPPTPHPHSPSYPRNCLVFVRNVHPGTNKTTVRALFVNALSGKVGSSISAGGEDRDSKNAIDYVDYTKGTDSCHLRLRSPSDAHFLVEHFKKQFIVQNAPLDDGGVEIEGDRSNEGDIISSSQRCIVVELVQGTREKIYWEKVPLKLRQDAVLRANTDLSEPFTDPPITSSTAVRPTMLELKTKFESKSSKKRNLACADVSVGETGSGERDGDRDGGEGVLLTEHVSRKKRRKKI